MKRSVFARASERALRTGRGLVTVPMFLLVPQVTLRKRLDVAGIECFYNPRRRHSTLGYLSPVGFEKQAALA